MVLCDAGFFYAGFSDCVRCYFCGGGLRNWEDGDTPWIEHARWFPNCDYLKRRKGDLFIQMHRQDQNEDPTFAPLPPPPSSPRESLNYAATKEMEKSLSNPSKEEDDIASRSVLEMGYSKPKVNSAIEQLRRRGKSKYSATDILEIILDEEEKATSSASACTNESQTPSQTSGTPSAKPSMASTECQSLLKENQTLKEQMICKICLDKDACIVYLPCGHMVTCQDCSKTIRKCCICRKLIQRTVKCYL